MNLHEYQSKKILASYGVPVPDGRVASSPQEAVAAAQARGGAAWVVKAQVHAGGRGKAGGVKLVRDLEAVRSAAASMLGQRLVTKQTGAAGLPIERVYVEVASDIERELYLSLTLNRERGRIALVASAAGGMDIEQVAQKSPAKILSLTVHPVTGLQPFQCKQLGFGLGLASPQLEAFQSLALGLYRLYLERDASLIEINPLIVTRQGALVALDAKLDIDANALFRQPVMAALRDVGQEDPMERRASEHDLNYVSLDGNIACMVNGAGLAMATMDIIQYAGGSPANFLDVGGGANQQQIEHAFEILLSDQNVQAVFINIFGGILRVDTLAHGVVEAAKKTNVQVPVVLRLEGTNVEQGREILKNSGLNFIIGETMQDAAAKVVKAAKEKAATKK